MATQQPSVGAPAAAHEPEKAPLTDTTNTAAGGHGQHEPSPAAAQGNGHPAGGEKAALPQIDTSAQPQQHSTAPQSASTTTAPQTAQTAPQSAAPTSAGNGPQRSSKQIKADLKNEQAFAKVLKTKSAAEGKELKTAIKDGQSSVKTDEKAAGQELKAKKALDKALRTEYKLNKQLVDIKAKYDAAVVALEQAKAKLELKQSHHETTTALRDEKLHQIEELKRRSMAGSNPTSPTGA